jgi:hypothetical protein
MITPADFRIMLITLDDFLNSEGVNEADIDVWSEHLVMLSHVKKDIASIYDSFATRMVDRMQSEKKTELTLSTGAEIKCKVGSARKSWDNKGLMVQVFERLQQSSIDMDTGEVALSTEEIVNKILDYVQPSYWRVGALSELGINADMFCEVAEPKTNIAIYLKGEKK